jgi:hypothetical protein
MTQGAFSGKEEPYADLWKRGSLEEKKLFVSGISIGLSLMKNYSKAQLRSQAPDSAGQMCDSTFIDRIYEELGYLEQGFVEENVVKAMDVLYKKEKNREFPFQQMYIIAIQEIKRLKK